MDTASGGYTIVEVMIVLAITSVLFFSAVTVFNSQRASTNFSQAMQDVNSQIQSYANRVVTSSYPGSENYTCSVSPSTSRAILTTTTPGSGSACLFLGLAIQALPTQTSLQIYTILGNKDIYNGASDTLSPATSIDGPQGANPEPALAGGINVLMDNYAISSSASVVSSKVVSLSGVTSSYDLVGFYNGLPADSVAYSSGTSALVLHGYAAISAAQVKNCIEESGCTNLPIKQWLICFQDSGSTNRALLTVNSAPGGISTKLSFVACTYR